MNTGSDTGTKVPADDVVIRTFALEKHYGRTIAVKGLDLEVRRGEVFGLLGPNGAGKTTTILMLLGLSSPTSGRAEVLGMDPTRSPLPIKRHVGYLPDNVGFYGNMTGRQNLRYTCALNGIDGDDAEKRISSWLERVGLTRQGDDRVDSYSRGMRQRLGLADALVKDPSVLVLDEPTTSIDPVGVSEILELVSELAHDDGVAVLLSSHLLAQVQQICDRIAIFVAGEAVAVGTVAELAAREAGRPTVSLELGVDGDPAQLESLLLGVAGVTEVRPSAEDHHRWVVTGRAGVIDPVLRALLDAGRNPWLVKDLGMDLDDIYRRYFAGAELAPGLASEALIAGSASTGPAS
jgi:ABC-2 type transport system ATP-binding protein